MTRYERIAAIGHYTPPVRPTTKDMPAEKISVLPCTSVTVTYEGFALSSTCMCSGYNVHGLVGECINSPHHRKAWNAKQDAAHSKECSYETGCTAHTR